MSKSKQGNLYDKPAQHHYWFVESVKEVLKTLNSSHKGLSQKEADNRLKEHGSNSIEKKDAFGALKLLLNKFNSIIIYVLLVTAGISLYLDQVVEFYAILGIIGFTVVLGFIQEFRAERSVEALAALTSKKVEVIRDGKRKQILSEHVVPGDVLRLTSGLVAPADLRIIESNNLSVNESILTGESVPKGKDSKPVNNHEADISERSNLVFSGTSIMNGTGLGVVIATGFESEIGKISETLKSIKGKKTPLQKKVDTMSARVSYAVIFISIVAFFLLIGRGEEVPVALILATAIAVGGIPEGFPLALTLALSSGVRRMAKSNAIIKDMGSVETLGTTTAICTDKTGTLTQNKMMVVKLDLNDKEFDITGKPYEPSAEFFHNSKKFNEKNFENKEFFLNCILNNNSEIEKKDDSWKLAGEPTEGALLGLARAVGYDEVVLRENHKRILEIPFDSAKKYMITVNNVDNKKIAFLKGAVEQVLDKSTHILKNGKVKRLNVNQKSAIKRKVNKHTGESLRVLALASKDVTKVKGSKRKLESEVEKGYVFQGFVGIEDPIRADVKEAIEECKTAGIRIIMVTGDHKSTATAIGKQLGLITKRTDRVIEGRELDSWTDEELDELISEIVIFSRTTPDHKFRIVKSLQRNGEVVAMTGDGVNDAPALKQADIGVSMGKEGTDVARESSNMVLADDAFSSIVKAVKEGRTIYSNIRRFTYYLLTINVAEVMIVLTAIMLNLVTPLTALMILFINVITSSLPSLGLSVEPTNEKVMYHKPRNPKEKLLSSYILIKIFTVVPLIIAGAMALFYYDLNFGSGDINKARTLAFTTIVVFELFHAFNARSLHTSVFKDRLFGNKYFYMSLLAAIIMIFVSIHTSWGNSVLSTVPLTGMEWLLIITIGSSILIFSEVMKLMIKSEIDEQKRLQGKELRFE